MRQFPDNARQYLDSARQFPDNARVSPDNARRPGPILLAECDPAGGSLLAGYLSRYDLPTDRGILPLAGAALRGSALQELSGLLIDLDNHRAERFALPGLTDPAQGASLAPAWSAVGEFFAGLSRAGWTVIADCGRLASGFPPWPLLRQADAVLVGVRPASLATISPAVPALAQLRRELPATDGTLALLAIGGGTSPRELSRHLMAPVAAEIAWDTSTATVLGGKGRGRRRGALMRTAARAVQATQALILSDRAARLQLPALPGGVIA
ncbi:MAG: ParA family protein [Hamadaea sp.]|uniref:ParA family protein n=1 Tax=Hamadaea sp. TaxID=2024425 RepID=UPI00182D9B85|nr:ParA family protein [Hamadaea sp.]NUR72220.1 ParA family protein [Hamadaea sp.]NUT22113.1 ParA family protein [Hamadaea sp.]